MLRIKWKKEILDNPFFCDYDYRARCIREDKAFPYTKYRDEFVRLGPIAGIEEN